ncbi:MAG: 3-isopropylmalate dehydratase small subunit [bacterium]|nr:3-isopropylmalate dehydratase small subunit [bacterium]
MKPIRIREIQGRVVPLPRDDVDSDQLAPARFLHAQPRGGVVLLHDWRFAADGSARPDSPLDHPVRAGAEILLAGANFGCGSSREHAVWACLDFGLKAIVATSFADIFRANAWRSGLLTVEVDAETHGELLAAVAADPSAEVVISLEELTLTLPGGRRVGFAYEPFARRCLLEGSDALDVLLGHDDAITRWERERSQT